MKCLQLYTVICGSFLILVNGQIKRGPKSAAHQDINNVSVCTTPNGEAAICQPWYNCKVLIKALAKEEPSSKEFAKASKCVENSMVCCGSSGNFIEKMTFLMTNFTESSNDTNEAEMMNFTEVSNDTNKARIDFALRKLLPDKRYCGYQHTDDYFYNKNETSLDEFPWLVHIPLRHVSSGGLFSDLKDLRCTGFIISNRYVITDSWCGSESGIIDKVMIGQYHRDKPPTCIEDTYFPECTDPLIEVKVTEILTPDVQSKYKINIKLLRLEEKLTFTDYVRPICLPLELDESRRAKINDIVVTSGWGALYFEGSKGKIKKRFKHTLKRTEQKGLCVKAQDRNNTVCQGDNGGPLMSSYRSQWLAEGVISFVDTVITCADSDQLMCTDPFRPVHIEWILLNMKP